MMGRFKRRRQHAGACWNLKGTASIDAFMESFFPPMGCVPAIRTALRCVAEASMRGFVVDLVKFDGRAPLGMPLAY